MLAIFLDIEASGLDFFRHRALEIALKIVDLHNGQELYTYDAIVKQPLDVWEKRDPASIEINGFTWEKCCSGKDEATIRQEIIKIFTDAKITRGKAIFICQNPAFDRGFFSQIVDAYIQEKQNWPYHWLDFASMYWAIQVKQHIADKKPFPYEINLSKNSIATQHQLPIESSPHGALNGVNHLIMCYQAVVGFD